MEISEQTVTTFLSGAATLFSGALGIMWRRDINRTDATIKDLKESIKECDDDRELLHKKQEAHIKRTAELETALGISKAECHFPECPKKKLIETHTHRVSVTPQTY